VAWPGGALFPGLDVLSNGFGTENFQMAFHCEIHSFLVTVALLFLY